MEEDEVGPCSGCKECVRLIVMFLQIVVLVGLNIFNYVFSKTVVGGKLNIIVLLLAYTMYAGIKYIIHLAHLCSCCAFS